MCTENFDLEFARSTIRRLDMARSLWSRPAILHVWHRTESHPADHPTLVEVGSFQLSDPISIAVRHALVKRLSLLGIQTDCQSCYIAMSPACAQAMKSCRNKLGLAGHSL